MVLKLPWAQKRMFWAFEKGIFQFFYKVCVTKLKQFSWKLRENVRSYLDQKLIKGSFLENGFEGILSSKTNVPSVWKRHFSVFCKFLSDKVEIVFWENEAKQSKLFKSKTDHMNFLRKWFWSYLELKSEYSGCLKRAIFNFLEIFEWHRRHRFLGKWGKAFRTI